VEDGRWVDESSFWLFNPPSSMAVSLVEEAPTTVEAAAVVESGDNSWFTKYQVVPTKPRIPITRKAATFPIAFLSLNKFLG
jgi:hypothetical protein